MLEHVGPNHRELYELLRFPGAGGPGWTPFSLMLDSVTIKMAKLYPAIVTGALHTFQQNEEDASLLFYFTGRAVH